MSLASRLLEFAKDGDALLGRGVAAFGHGGSRTLPDDPSDVLVIRLWGLGNLALMAPLFAANAGRRVRLLTLQRNAAFVRRHLPGVDLLGVPDPVSPAFPFVVADHARSMARDRPDVVVDCEQFLRLPLALARLASSAACVGLDTPGQGRGRLLDAPVAYDPVRHVSETFAAIWAAAGLATAPGPGGLQARPEEHTQLRRRLGLDDRPLVVLHPGSGDHFPGRRWPAERYGALLPLLAEDGRRQLVVTGTRSERRLTARVLSAAALACSEPVLDLTGELDVIALIDLLAGAALLVTNDTGPLHIADALGTRTVGLFGPNTPHRYGPRSRGSLALHADLPCSPCLDDRHMKRSACRHFSCMTSLSVPDVAVACQVAIDQPVQQARTKTHARTH
jgi:heptosyltransferase-2